MITQIEASLQNPPQDIHLRYDARDAAVRIKHRDPVSVVEAKCAADRLKQCVGRINQRRIVTCIRTRKKIGAAETFGGKLL